MDPIAFDVGNSNVTAGRIRSGRVESAAVWPLRDPSVWAWPDGEPPPADLPRVAASVNPEGLATLERWLASRDRRLTGLIGREIPLSIEARVRSPEEVGTDRRLAALAAHRRCGGKGIVIDLGTATTFDLVDADGAYLGGAIAPGLTLCARALDEHTALVPLVTLAEPEEPIGKDTESCVRIGVVEGYRGLVERLLDRFRKALGEPVTVFATGGDLPLLGEGVRGIDHRVDHLVLEGIAHAWADFRVESPSTRR